MMLSNLVIADVLSYSYSSLGWYNDESVFICPIRLLIQAGGTTSFFLLTC
jgi:hypothetical protein